MKRIFVSVGLAAIGAGSMSALADAYTGMDSGSKPWSVSLTLRGYYSDNIDTAPKGRNGYGFDVSPAVHLHLSNAQTDFTAEYIYDATYYDKAPAGNNGDHFDQTHTFEFGLQHQFSKRYSISVNDTFVIGQEPDQLQQVGGFSEFQRVSGDNIHNDGTINFDAQITELFGIELGYENSFWSYDSTKFGFTTFDGTLIPLPPPFPPFAPNPSTITPSLAGLNDRIEQTVHLDTHWSVTPTTTLIVGYQFVYVDYTGDQAIQAINATNAVSTSTNSFQEVRSNTYHSDVRNSYSHYAYVGASHSFLPNLTASVKVGARYTDNYNDPNGTTSIEPYVNLNVNYAYAQQSYLAVGFSHDRTSNDRAGGSGTAIVQDSDSSTLFALLHQRITPKFFGTVTGTFQDSVINAPGSPLDGEEDRYYILSLDFEYKFTRNFSMTTGYSYDRLDSAVSNGSYTKNTVYLGATIGY